jgi:hypothetical protein
MFDKRSTVVEYFPYHTKFEALSQATALLPLLVVASSCSKVVEHSPHHTKVKAPSLATSTVTMREKNDKKYKWWETEVAQ